MFQDPIRGFRLVRVKGGAEMRKDCGDSGGLERYGAVDERYCMAVPEAARRLGVSRNFGYELVKRGELPVIRFGKRLLIPKVALEKMLERGVTGNNLRTE
jgi:excisionase family DNA binding protein